METYYQLRQRRVVDEGGEDLDAIGLECDDEILEWPWRQGVRFDPPPPIPLKMRIEADASADGYFRDYLASPVPVFSRRLAAALQAAGVSNLELFAIDVEDTVDWPEFPGYVAVNVIGTVSVADPERSLANKAFGVDGANLFDKFVPRTDIACGLSMFRSAEQLSTILVSEKVRSRCLAAGIDTVDFVPLSER